MRLPAFQTLLDDHGRDVYRFLIARAGPVDADDIFQETCLAALRAYPDLRDASNLRSWLFTIAHRKVIDHVRGRARRAVPTDAVEEMAPAVSDPQPRVGDDVWTAVAALPDKQRTAVTLRYVTDAAYAEIGAAMDTSEEAARRNVHEALKRLREEEHLR